MAEGTAAATAAPSGGPRSKGGSGSSSMPFWKSLTSRKKSKDAPSVAAPRPLAEPSEMPPPAPPSPSDSRENQQQPSSGSRRNLKVSRSGRFKEKRRCRCALPTDNPQQLFEGAAPEGAHRAVCPGGEAPCQ